jgi:L-lactate dehydrogenase complex protein LldG
MLDARDEILGRIRAALADVPRSERSADVPVTRDYRRADDRPHDELVTLFAQRVGDYRADELDRIDGALTGCAAAIAETGTIVLDGGAVSGRRALTLVPDHHICVVTAEQIHGQLADALTAVAAAVTGQQAPITLVSGPSATSDIELERVEGVHGPRHLSVLVVGG